MKYHTLLTMENGRWYIQFGDYDKDVVKQEKEDDYSGFKTKIITTGDSQEAIDKKVAELNAALGGAA